MAPYPPLVAQTIFPYTLEIPTPRSKVRFFMLVSYPGIKGQTAYFLRAVSPGLYTGGRARGKPVSTKVTGEPTSTVSPGLSANAYDTPEGVSIHEA